MKFLAKAYPDENAEDDDDDDDYEEEKPAKKNKGNKGKSGFMNKPVDDEEEDWEDEEEEIDYEELSAKELYKLCKARDIDVMPKKPEKYYIKKLQEYDKAQEDWEDDEEDCDYCEEDCEEDSWDDEEDYEDEEEDDEKISLPYDEEILAQDIAGDIVAGKYAIEAIQELYAPVFIDRVRQLVD